MAGESDTNTRKLHSSLFLVSYNIASPLPHFLSFSSYSGGAGNYQLSSAQLLGGWASQVKAVAEYVNFKICYYFMREALHADAVTQVSECV